MDLFNVIPPQQVRNGDAVAGDIPPPAPNLIPAADTTARSRFITQLSPQSASNRSTAEDSDSASSKSNTDEADPPADGYAEMSPGANENNVKSHNKGGGDDDIDNASAHERDDGSEQNDGTNNNSENAEEEENARQDKDNDHQEKAPQEKETDDQETSELARLQYTVKYARSLRGRRFISSFIGGTSQNNLKLKRITFDVCDDAWNRFLQGEDTEFVVPQDALDALKAPNVARQMQEKIIPLFTDSVVNVDFGNAYFTEDPPNPNPYGMLPTFKENTKLEVIGDKIQSKQPKFFDLDASLRKYIREADLNVEGIARSPSIDVKSFADEVKEILKNNDDIYIIEIERPWKDKNDRKGKPEDHDSDDDSYEVDYGSVFDSQVFPQDEHNPDTLDESYSDCQPQYRTFNLCHIALMTCIYVKSVYNRYRDEYEYEYKDDVSGASSLRIEQRQHNIKIEEGSAVSISYLVFIVYRVYYSNCLISHLHRMFTNTPLMSSVSMHTSLISSKFGSKHWMIYFRPKRIGISYWQLKRRDREKH